MGEYKSEKALIKVLRSGVFPGRFNCLKSITLKNIKKFINKLCGSKNGSHRFKNFNVNYKDKDGYTALTHAIRKHRNPDVILYLISIGAKNTWPLPKEYSRHQPIKLSDRSVYHYIYYEYKKNTNRTDKKLSKIKYNILNSLLKNESDKRKSRGFDDMRSAANLLRRLIVERNENNEHNKSKSWDRAITLQKQKKQASKSTKKRKKEKNTYDLDSYIIMFIENQVGIRNVCENGETLLYMIIDHYPIFRCFDIIKPMIKMLIDFGVNVNKLKTHEQYYGSPFHRVLEKYISKKSLLRRNPERIKVIDRNCIRLLKLLFIGGANPNIAGTVGYNAYVVVSPYHPPGELIDLLMKNGVCTKRVHELSSHDKLNSMRDVIRQMVHTKTADYQSSH